MKSKKGSHKAVEESLDRQFKKKMRFHNSWRLWKGPKEMAYKLRNKKARKSFS